MKANKVAFVKMLYLTSLSFGGNQRKSFSNLFVFLPHSIPLHTHGHVHFLRVAASPAVRAEVRLDDFAPPLEIPHINCVWGGVFI